MKLSLVKKYLNLKKNQKKIFTKTPDTNICWRVWGTGKPTIFLHGGYGSWKHWIKQIYFFSKITLYSFLICQDSEILMIYLNLILQIKLQNLMDGFLKINPITNQKINVVGFSFGGLIAGHLSYQFSKSNIVPENCFSWS